MGRSYTYCLVFGILMVDFLWHTATTVKNDPTRIAINSVFYYNTSKFYSNNTMVMLINAPTFSNLTRTFICISANDTSTLSVETTLRLATSINIACKWMTMLMNCTTVDNPSFFFLTVPQSRVIVPIKFEEPIREVIPVVACFAPVFLEERWQTLIVSIEIYHHFGVNLQVHYVHSAMGSIYKILKKYEERKFLKIRKFALLEFDKGTEATLGYNPTNELDGRNQPTSYTDCLMKYREAADFIFIIDADDIFLPTKTSNYYSELQLWNTLYPTASAFVFRRYGATISTSSSFDKFSLEATLGTLRISNKSDWGKSAFNPKYAESAWIHWPGINNDSSISVPANESLFLHLRTWTYLDDCCDEFSEPPFDAHNLQLFDILSEKEATNMSNTSTKHFPLAAFKDLKINGAYSKAIDDCYSIFRDWAKYNKDPIPCVTPSSDVCNLPQQVPGFDCITAKQKRSTYYVGSSVILNIPADNVYWVSQENGCAL